MVTDPPPTNDTTALTRRTMLKLTSVAVVGGGSVAGCLGTAAPTTDAAALTGGLSYGGVPLRLAGGLSPAFSLVGPCDGLVAHWPLDGTTGTVTDVAGGNDGAVRGTPQQGVPGVYETTAYAFGSGPDDYVEVADATALAPDELTFGGWFRTDSGASAQTIVQKADARFGSEGYAMEVQTTNSLRAHLAVESGQASVNPWGVATQDGEWHHLACTWDGSSFVMYLDGAVVGRDNSQSGPAVHSDRPLYIGRGDNSYTSYYAMDGAIDDVRLYSRALSADEIGSLYGGTVTSTDTETDSSSETDTETDSGSETDTETDSGAETDSGTGTDSGTETTTDPSSQPAPAARWEFAETTGMTLADSAGSAEGFARGSPALDVDGVFESSGIAFAAPDEYVEVPDGSSLRPETALSFGGWFRTDSGAKEQTLVQKADARFGSEGYAMEVQTKNSLRAHVAVESGRATVNPRGIKTHDGEWHHLVCTWDGSSLVMYLDGTVVDRDDSQSGDVVHSPRSLYFGRGDNGYTSYYPLDGAVDDVRVYDAALTETQIAGLIENTTTDEPTEPEPDPEPSTVPNDEFGERGFGSYGYGGVTESDQ